MKNDSMARTQAGAQRNRSSTSILTRAARGSDAGRTGWGFCEAAERFLGAIKRFLNAESLGGVESLAPHSATTIHAALSAEERASLGITEGLVRLSIGIEDKEDLFADLEQALAVV
jgi:O-acetylhomoserine/O-acetylserine sulfhydrylase-like pyridoxal-dependent enzyme